MYAMSHGPAFLLSILKDRCCKFSRLQLYRWRLSCCTYSASIALRLY